MSIQKVSGLSPVISQNQASSKSAGVNDVVSKRNDTSLLKSDAIRNNALGSISFTGISKQIYKSSDSIEDIEHSIGQTVEKGRGREDDQGRTRVYYADPNEKISKKIKDSHEYIVKYKKMPQEPLREEIKQETSPEKTAKMIEDLKVIQDIEEGNFRANEEKWRKNTLSEKAQKAQDAYLAQQKKLNRKNAEVKERKERIQQIGANLEKAVSKYEDLTGTEYKMQKSEKESTPEKALEKNVKIYDSSEIYRQGHYRY